MTRRYQLAPIREPVALRPQQNRRDCLPTCLANLTGVDRNAFDLDLTHGWYDPMQVALAEHGMVARWFPKPHSYEACRRTVGDAVVVEVCSYANGDHHARLVRAGELVHDPSGRDETPSEVHGWVLVSRLEERSEPT